MIDKDKVELSKLLALFDRYTNENVAVRDERTDHWINHFIGWAVRRDYVK